MICPGTSITTPADAACGASETVHVPAPSPASSAVSSSEERWAPAETSIRENESDCGSVKSFGSSAFFITHGFKENAERAEADLIGGQGQLSDLSKIFYLEVIDATFSIDGVLGAFAFTLSGIATTRGAVRPDGQAAAIAARQQQRIASDGVGGRHHCHRGDRNRGTTGPSGRV